MNGDNEILSRVRRIETRVTKLCIAAGVETQSEQPVFVHGEGATADRVYVPSAHTSITDILASIPRNNRGVVDVHHADKFLVALKMR